MEEIALFTTRDQAIDGADLRAVDPACRRCSLFEGAKTVCLPAEGEPGGVLIVGEHPSRDDDAAKRPFAGGTGAYVRRLVKQWWSGPIAFDNAIRCAPGKTSVGPTSISRCRPFLAQTIEEVGPQRIVAMGGAAIQAILGRSPHVMSARGGYAWISKPHAIPVFFSVSPAGVARNRFQQQWFEEDLKRALTCEPEWFAPPPPWKATCRVVRTPEESREAVAELRRAPWFSYDVETAGRHHEPGFEILCLAACAAGSDAPLVWCSDAIADPAALAPLKELLADRKVGKVAQNAKYDALSVRFAWGTVVRPLAGDTMLARALLAPDAERGLELLQELVGLGGGKEEAHTLIEQAKDRLRDSLSRERADVKVGQRGFWVGADSAEPAAIPGLTPALSVLVRAGVKLDAVAYRLVPRTPLLRYNSFDALATARLWERFSAELEREPALHRVWTRSVRGAAEAVEHVQHWGAAVDRGAVSDLIVFLQGQVDVIQQKLDQYGENFNPDSPPQLAELLFKKLKLKPTKLTASGQASTDVEVLESLREKHPIVGAILEHRRLAKLLGTYAEGLLKHIRSDGRIHCDWKIDGTKTGRWSSKDPNLQNIPKAEEDEENPEAKMIKGCFVAPPGHVLLQADYRQVEYRVAAMISGDPVLIELFRQGHDMHLGTARIVSPHFKIDPAIVDKKHWLRNFSKTINFLMLYGGGDHAASKRLGCKVEEAAKVRSAIMGSFKVLARTLQTLIAEAKSTGYAWTFLGEGDRGRRSALWRIAGTGDDDKTRGERINAEHAATNHPMQGSAAEFTTRSLSELTSIIVEEGLPAKLVLTVHDSLVFEVPEWAVDEVADTVTRVMTGWKTPHDVPLEIDLEIGKSWGGMEKYEPRSAKT